MGSSARRRGPLVGLFAVALGLVLAEVAARFVHEAPWYDRLVAEQGASEGHEYARNAWGLRGPEPAVPKRAGHQRVLLLGDSFTFGQGVYEEEAIFARRLERSLKDDLPPGVSGLDVVNAGLPGSLTGDWVELFEKGGAVLAPDVVLFVFFLRDGTRSRSIPDFFGRIREDVVEPKRGSTLYRLSALYRIWRDRADRRRVGEEYLEHFRRSYFGDEEETREWRAAQENLLAIREQAERLGATVGLVVFPVLVELGDDYPFRAICEEIVAFGEKHGLPVHDLLPAYLGEDAPGLWVSSLDQHPNAEGHRIAANSIEPFLRSLLEDRAASSGQ